MKQIIRRSFSEDNVLDLLCVTESGPGIGCSRMLGTGNFPDFFGKYPVPGKWHSGMQTSSFNIGAFSFMLK